MAVERLRQQVGLLSFTTPRDPANVVVTTGSVDIFVTRRERAYCVVTLVVEAAPGEHVFAARDAFPVVGSGLVLALGVSHTFFGPLRLRATSATGGATVAFQDFDVAEGVALP